MMNLMTSKTMTGWVGQAGIVGNGLTRSQEKETSKRLTGETGGGIESAGRLFGELSVPVLVPVVIADGGAGLSHGLKVLGQPGRPRFLEP